MNIPKLPEPGTQAWEDMVAHMRKMNQYSGVIRAARESIEARGLNFMEEFDKWKKENNKNA